MKNYMLLLLLLMSVTASAQWSRNTAGTDYVYPSDNADLVRIGPSGIPTEVLHVFGNSIVSGNFTTGGNLTFGTTASTGRLHLNSTSNNFTLRLNATDRMTILNTNGRVGIGTSSPTSQLHVAGTTSPGAVGMEVENGGFKGVFESVIGSPNLVRIGSRSNLQLDVVTNNLTRMTFLTDGKVGIGTTTPAYPLDVNGIINATGLYVGGVPFVSSNWTVASGNIYRTTGNVGIGSATPATKLQVDIASANTTYASATNSDVSLTLKNANTTNNNLNILNFADANGSAATQIGTVTTNHTSHYGKLFFSTRGAGGLTQKMTIEENGNVGIGSLVPATKLQVDIASANTTYASATSSDVSLTLKNTNSTNNNLNILNFADANGSAATQIGTTTSDHTSHYGKLFFSTRGSGGLTKKMVITESGDIEIGSMVSGYMYMHVGGTVHSKELHIDSSTPSIRTGELSSFLSIYDHEDVPNGLNAKGVLVSDEYGYATPAANNLIVKGAVGIGTPFTSNPNSYKLAVNGKIGAKDLQIETTTTTWPDYVFEKSYALPALNDVEKYVKENKHLEGMPSAEEVKEKGYSVNELNEALLRKVEELTLYVIEQQKQIDELKKEVSGKKKRKN